VLPMQVQFKFYAPSMNKHNNINTMCTLLSAITITTIHSNNNSLNHPSNSLWKLRNLK
jgi:hypothetical protein